MRNMNFNKLLTDEEIKEEKKRIEGYGGTVIAVEKCAADNTTTIMFMP